MERKTETITLRRPIKIGDDMVTEVVVREPKGRDVFELGTPGQYMRTREGAMTYIEKDEVLLGYAERCIVKPDPLVAIQNMGVQDTLAVRDAIIGFFIEASAASDT